MKTAKHKATLANGRDRKPPTKFDDWWAKVYVSNVAHPAWRHLTASAKDVMIVITAKSSNAASKRVKDAAGRPKFKFTYSEAKQLLKMPTPTFSRAMNELKDKGFIKVSDPGGMLYGKGRPAEFLLSDKWKEWVPPPRNTNNIDKARAARKIVRRKLLSVDLSED